MASQRLTNDKHLDRAAALMDDFAERTGLISAREQKRYLWTDAFAVENFIHLARFTHDPRFDRLAATLVGAVHQTLGRHRPDETRRRGWLSGLEEAEGQAHPTVKGLRIGKKLPERGRGEPFDEQAEWQKDGQYFHYLTRWMMALHHLANHAGESRYQTWAEELAVAAHRAFTHHQGGLPRLYWKMSIDLSRPLVASMGQHDALDGLVTYLQLERTGMGLEKPIADFSAMIGGQDLTTSDPLGLGGLLMGACQLASLPDMGQLSDWLLTNAARGVSFYLAQAPFHRPAAMRLAFREFGLAQGLCEVGKLRNCPASIARFVDLFEVIVEFWLRRENRRNSSWSEHQDINEVMLASCLLSDFRSAQK